jgi:hypothetical protein
MHLQIAMLIEVDGHDTYHTINDYNDIVTFHANAPEYIVYFLKEYWQGISFVITGIAIPLITFLWKRRKKRSENLFIADLNLSDISKAGNHLVAIINEHTFRIGEENYVTANNKAVKIKCLDIWKSSVLIKVVGIRKPIVLKMK